MENFELPVRAGAFAHDPFDVGHLAFAPKFVDFGGNKFHQLVEQTAGLDFLFAAKIDELAFDAVTRGAPAILIEQPAAINAEGRILPEQFVELRNYGLDQGGDCEGIVDARLRIADAHFQGVEKRMEPDVPPDFLGVIDATGLDEELAKIFVLGEGLEGIGNSGAWKAFEHLQAITFQAGVLSHPKRRVHRERVDVRQKITRLVHHVDRGFAAWDSDMDMQAEDQVGPREPLHV